MKSKLEIAIAEELMSKHGLTNKDLFSFCICAVNFLEYYQEEGMYDVMYSCPERYSEADSNNTKAVAGALKGEQKAEKWTDVDQFAYYMRAIQQCVEMEVDEENLDHFFEEFERFAKVYRREVMVPFMLGCPVEDYDDSRFDDEEYLKSIINVDNLSIYKAHEEEMDKIHKKYQEEEAAKLAKEVEEKKGDESFTVLLAACVRVDRYQSYYEEYNKKYYPDRDYKVIPMKNPQTMVVQTGGKSLEEIKKRLLDIVKDTNIIAGYTPSEQIIPVEKAFKDVPKILVDYKVTHVVGYL
jgi:hypothetical protein